MKHLIDLPVFECVRESLRRSKAPKIEEMVANYDDFTASLIVAIKTEKSPLNLLRSLRLIHVEVSALGKWLEYETFEGASILTMLLWKVHEVVAIELDIVKLRIRQHGLTVPPIDSDGELPAVFWSKNYTVTDLMELLVALHRSGAIVFRDGAIVSLSMLVRIFGQIFNIEIKEPRKLRSNIKMRKLHEIKFINVLLASLTEMRRA